VAPFQFMQPIVKLRGVASDIRICRASGSIN
jgi:hypothetical protein